MNREKQKVLPKTLNIYKVLPQNSKSYTIVSSQNFIPYTPLAYYENEPNDFPPCSKNFNFLC